MYIIRYINLSGKIKVKRDYEIRSKEHYNKILSVNFVSVTFEGGQYHFII